MAKKKNKKKQSRSSNQVMDYFNRYFQIVLGVIVVIALSLTVFFLYNSYVTQIEKINSQLDLKRQELAGKQQNLLDVKQLKVDYQNLEAEAQGLFDALPDAASLPDLYMQLQGLVSRNDFVLKSFNVSEADAGVEDESVIRPLVLNVNFEGSDYGAFKRLLIDFEKSLRVMDVTSINYDPRSEEFSLIVTTYYKLEG